MDERNTALVKENLILPLIALRGRVLFPKNLLNFDVGRPMSVKAVQTASQTGSLVFIASQKNAFVDAPKKSDICTVGVIAKIKQIIKVPSGNMKVNVEAVCRGKIVEFKDCKEYFCAEIQEAPYIETATETEMEAYFRVAKNAFYEYTLYDKRITKEMITSITEVDNPDRFMDSALSITNFKEMDVYKILEEDYTVKRLELFEKLFKKELEIGKIEKKISEKVRESIDKSQKEFYLREQLKAIHEELGDSADEREELLASIKAKKLPKDIEDKMLKEIARLDKINPSSPDYSIILNYLDWIKELPFNENTVDTSDLEKAQKILDSDHFGLEKVKQRILEYLAVLHLTKQIKGPILCFVGPPGVGKTSVATSIARALNRKFVRMSLGGVKDEAEIRGHRKTYVGAMPGRIINGLKTAGSNNPVFLLDEIDKLSSDIHGDPASALLEVLDPDTIPYPLLDRMELIELTGYTGEEKLQIAKRYLIPKQLKQNGLTKSKANITDDAIKEVIECYTMEAGVRNLERELGSIVRKIATCVAKDPNAKKTTVKAKDVFNYLGVKKYQPDQTLQNDEVGACTGLAWTRVGGTTLTIEVSLMRGKGEILLTGKLGDVMKESARAALTYIRANADKFGIDDEKFEKTDLHIHVPEGATPKDGPSAGITMATAILSAFTGKSVKKSVAMTGEITLRGKVLAIGGLKEKALAAYRQGIKTVIIPKANEKDLSEIPQDVVKEMNFITVTDVQEVFQKAINF